MLRPPDVQHEAVLAAHGGVAGELRALDAEAGRVEAPAWIHGRPVDRVGKAEGMDRGRRVGDVEELVELN